MKKFIILTFAALIMGISFETKAQVTAKANGALYTLGIPATDTLLDGTDTGIATSLAMKDGCGTWTAEAQVIKRTGTPTIKAVLQVQVDENGTWNRMGGLDSLVFSTFDATNRASGQIHVSGKRYMKVRWLFCGSGSGTSVSTGSVLTDCWKR